MYPVISKIEIENFRSIKKISLEPHGLISVIGPNSSGKTNVLKAIDLVLGEGWTTKAKVARELFNDPEKDISIKIEFDEQIVVPSNNPQCQPTRVNSIELSMSLMPELTAKTTVNGGNTFYGHEKFKKLCHFIYIPSERNLASELRVSQWTMLGKLMRLVYDNYVDHYRNQTEENVEIDPEQQLKDEFKAKMMEAKNFLEHDFSETEVTFKKFVNKFKDKCKKNSAGLANNFEPILDIYNLNWFYKTLQIHVEEDLPNQHFDSEEVGAGMQNLLMISIFQTYSELMGGKVIFGIEEPEIYLYPQAQRALYKNFISISETTQIFYTTHNPNFVDAARPDDIFLLRKQIEEGTYKLKKDNYFNNQNAEKHKYQIYTNFNPERNELFFAKKVLLVEGDSDKILFTSLCEDKWEIDLDRAGISIISCGGKGGVNYFIGVCKLVGINDYFAVWDKDDQIENSDNLQESLNVGKGIEIDPNLENFLKLPEGDGAQKVKNAYEWAQHVETDKIPELFNNVKSFIGNKKDIAEQKTTEPDDKEDGVDITDIPF